MSSVLVLAMQVAAATQVAQATLTGTIRDAESGRPLIGATVTLVDMHRATRTSVAGTYAFRGVPAGPQHIAVRFMGHAQRTLHALVPQDGLLEINVSLVAVPTRLATLEVRPTVIVPGADEDPPHAGHDRSVSLTAVRNYPQLMEPDVFLALGGGWVHAQPESPSGLHIRGGASDQTAYLLDNIPVFSPYHTAGVFSGWNPDAIAKLDLSGSAPRVTEPHALSGTVSAATRAPSDRVQAQGTASTSHARVTVDGPLGTGGAGFLVSGRGGYPTIVARKGDGSYSRGMTRDWLAKIEAPVWRGRLRVLGYLSENELHTAAIAEAVRGPQRPDSGPRNLFEWSSTSIGAAWERESAAATWRAVVWSARSGAGSAWLAHRGPLGMASAWRTEGLSVAAERRGEQTATTWGARVERMLTGYRIDSAGSTASIWDLDGHSWLGTLLSEHDRALGAHWRVRLGAAVVGGAGTVRVSPRVQLRWQWTDALSLTGSYSRLHQLAQSLRNSESITSNVFPVDLYVGAGTSNVPVAASDQGVLDLEYRHASGARMGAQAYARKMDGLVLVAPVDPEPFATRSFAVGSGTARGASVDFAKSAQRWGLTANYGVQHVEYTLGATRFAPGYGTRHVAEAGIIVFPMATASVRLGVASEAGRRTTLLAGGFEWEACNLRDRGCEFAGSPRANGGPLGGAVLPRYTRIDLGVQKHWHLTIGGRDALVALFGAVTNVAGRRNVLTYTRDPVSGAQSAVEMRPQAPLVVGLDWRF